MTVLAGVDTDKAAPLGLLVLVLLCVGCYFLFKSMSRHLRKVRDEWPAELPQSPSGGQQPTSANPADPPAPENSEPDAAPPQP